MGRYCWPKHSWRCPWLGLVFVPGERRHSGGRWSVECRLTERGGLFRSSNYQLLGGGCTYVCGSGCVRMHSSLCQPMFLHVFVHISLSLCRLKQRSCRLAKMSEFWSPCVSVGVAIYTCLCMFLWTQTHRLCVCVDSGNEGFGVCCRWRVYHYSNPSGEIFFLPNPPTHPSPRSGRQLKCVV